MKSRPSLIPSSLRLLRALGACVFAAALASCAAPQAYREGTALLAVGKTEQGMAKLEEAVRLDPKNAEYRIAVAFRRSSIINSLIMGGEAARREGRLTDAEKAYRQVQTMDAQNAMARLGLESLAMTRRHRQVVEAAEVLFKKGSAADYNDALDMLRPVLSENPSQGEALNLKARINEARSKEQQRPEIKLAATFRTPISLEFREAPLKSVLEVVARVSGLNFFYDKDIRPDLKVTLFAKNTTTEDALRLLLVTSQLEQKVLSANSILIYPSTPQKLKEYQTLAVRSFYLTNADVKAVSNSIKTIVKTKDLVIDERLGIIIMRDTPEAIRVAERIVALQDLTDPEVMLEVEIMEIKRSRLRELGVQWPTQLTLAPLQIAGAPLTLGDLRNLNRNTVQATIGSLSINAHNADQDGNILANPRIRVRNKEKAKIQIGDRVPLITTTSTSTGFVAESVSYVDVGLKLEVEPTIYLDEEVGIKVNLEVSNLVREIVSKSGTLSYQIGTRGATTVLRLKDGETQILAGLISDEDRSTANKVPLLGELPLAGRLFGSHSDTTDRSEILLSITPRVLRSIRRPELMIAEFESGTESNIGAQTLRLSVAEVAPGSAGESPRPPGTAPAAAVPGQVLPATLQGALPRPALPAATVPPSAPSGGTPSAGTGGVSLLWQAPAQVKVGEQFSAVLRVSSQQALRGMPVLIGFDPQTLQVVSVQEGEFFKQGNGQTSFSQRVDPAQGKIFVALVRQSRSGNEAGINGAGGLVSVTFKALKATPAARWQLLSATPEPLSSSAVAVPVDQVVRVIP